MLALLLNRVSLSMPLTAKLQHNYDTCPSTKSDPAQVACMRKLLVILNAMVKNNTPWRETQVA
jgi:hypothetical protein